ncbi:hypothetical protein MTO96_039216 [Rhipicephalus appendiculatus]
MMTCVKLTVMVFMHSAAVADERSEDISVTHGVANFLTEPYCYPAFLEELVRVIENYLNITHLVRINPPVPVVPHDIFPEERSSSGHLIRGVTDIALPLTTVTERRAFSAEFLIPLEYFNPCVVKGLFEHTYITSWKHPSAMALRNTVQNWSQFIASSQETCAERTRRRQAIFFSSSGVLQKFATTIGGQVQISRVYAEDVMRPAAFLLPRASPYKELLNNMLMRTIDAGLVDEIQRRHWQRTLRRPHIVESENIWQQLQLNESTLPFIVLGAGLGISCAVFFCELLPGILKKRQ